MRRLVLRRAQLRPQGEVPNKRVKRQITVIVIIGVGAPSLLKAVETVAHRVEIHNDLPGMFGQAPRAHLTQAGFHLGRVVRQFVAAACSTTPAG